MRIRTTITLQPLVQQAGGLAEQSILQTQPYMPMVLVMNILLLPVSEALGIMWVGLVKSKFSTNNFKKIRIPQFSETRFGSFVGLFLVYKQ